MKYLSVLTFLILFSFYSYSNETKDYFKFFPANILETASDTSGLQKFSPMEKEVLMWTNLARMAPKEFAEMLTAYTKSSSLYTSNNTYVISLKKDLLKAVPIKNPLQVHKTLNELALSHAEFGKRTGKYGHQNIEQRVSIVKNKMKYLSYAENCSYHYENALDAFMSLLIDNGIKDLGHRKTILNPRFTHIGISILPYTKPGEYILIQSFSSK